MRKIFLYYFVFFIISFTACKSNQETYEGDKRIINFGEAVTHQQEINLSQIADSVSLIPLETNSSIFLRNTNWIEHIPPYINYASKIFDYNGNFICSFESQGQGPGEEPMGYRYIAFNRKMEKFITKGSKLIMYDKTGEYAHKEKNLFALNEHGWNPNNKSMDINASVDNIVINIDNDSLWWINKDLETMHIKSIPKGGAIGSLLDNYSRYFRTFTSHKDSSIFYNYWNDTIYRILSDDISPRWIVDMGTDKIPETVHEKYDELIEDLFLRTVAAGRGGNRNIEDAGAIQLTKGKKGIWAINETTDYLFLLWSEIVPRVFFRDVEAAPLQIAFFNKHTGKTIAVKGSGFTDDILGTGPYNPIWGCIDDKLLKIIWPHELAEFIENNQAKGRKVHPRLLEMNERLDDDDNPFMMLVHLKK